MIYFYYLNVKRNPKTKFIKNFVEKNLQNVTYILVLIFFGILLTASGNSLLLNIIKKNTTKLATSTPNNWNQNRNLSHGGAKKDFFINSRKFDTRHPTVFNDNTEYVYSLSSKKDARFLSWEAKDRVEFVYNGRPQIGTRTKITKELLQAVSWKTTLSHIKIEKQFALKDAAAPAEASHEKKV